MPQNKYKLPPDVRGTVINIVKGYDRRAADHKITKILKIEETIYTEEENV